MKNMKALYVEEISKSYSLNKLKDELQRIFALINVIYLLPFHNQNKRKFVYEVKKVEHKKTTQYSNVCKMELCLKEIIKDVDINLYNDIIGILNTNKIEKFIKVNDHINYNIGGFWIILSHRLSECLNKPEDLKEDQEEEENYDKKLLIEFISLNKSK